MKALHVKYMLGAMITSSIVAEAFMVLGYFMYEAIVLGLGVGATGAIVGNIGQGLVGVIVSCIVSPALKRSREINEMLDRL